MSTYTNHFFLNFIDKTKVKTIFEIGTRDGWDTLSLYNYYQTEDIHTFECNPESVQITKQIYNQNKMNFVKFNNMAIWKTTGKIKFYPVKHSYHKHLNPNGDPSFFEKNIGASSCYPESGLYGEKYIQDEIFVNSITLNDYCFNNNIKSIDLLCMDTQGAEYDIIEGSLNILPNIKYIILEMNKMEVYKNQKIYDDVKNILENNGFYMAEFVSQCDSFGDGLFINKNI